MNRDTLPCRLHVMSEVADALGFLALLFGQAITDKPVSTWSNAELIRRFPQCQQYAIAQNRYLADHAERVLLGRATENTAKVEKVKAKAAAAEATIREIWDECQSRGIRL